LPEVMDPEGAGPAEHVIIEGEDEVSRRLCTGCIRCVRETGGPETVDPLLLGLGAERSQRWAYVGSGQGHFEKSQSYMYVGEGAGAFEKEVAANEAQWRLRKVCWAFLLVCVVAVLAYFVLSAVQADEVIDRQAAVRMQRPATSTMAPAFSCTAGAQWSHQEEEWCCRQPGGRCTTTARPKLSVAESSEFDCDLGLQRWRLAWPQKKKLWCCSHRQRGCLPGMPRKPPTTTAAPSSAKPSTTKPSTTKQRTPQIEMLPEVHSASLATLAPYNCEEGLEHWGGRWPEKKKAWCCEHERRGCPTTTRRTTAKPAATAAPTRPPAAPTRPPQTTPRTTRAPHDCGAGVEEEWSDSKRRRCCGAHGRGCPPRYDCLRSYFDWRAAWSGEKRRWCCEHEEKACSE